MTRAFTLTYLFFLFRQYVVEAHINVIQQNPTNVSSVQAVPDAVSPELTQITRDRYSRSSFPQGNTCGSKVDSLMSAILAMNNFLQKPCWEWLHLTGSEQTYKGEIWPRIWKHTNILNERMAAKTIMVIKEMAWRMVLPESRGRERQKWGDLLKT